MTEARLLVPPAFPLGPVRHARDIPDEAFLDAIRRARKGISGATRWDVGSALAGLPVPTDFSTEPPIPEKVVLAKARRLIKRGLIDGCCCGCRGDFRINSDTRVGNFSPTAVMERSREPVSHQGDDLSP